MLETVYVEDTDEHLSAFLRLAVLSSQALIDNGNEPFKKTNIHKFRHGVANNSCLCTIESCDDLLRACNDLLFDGPFLELCLVNT